MQSAELMREKLFTIRMTPEERDRAERVARHYGLNVAGVIRFLFKREDDAIALAMSRTPGAVVAAALYEASELVEKAAIPGVVLGVRDDLSDAMTRRYSLTVGDRLVARDLDLVGLEKTLAEWKRNGVPQPAPPPSRPRVRMAMKSEPKPPPKKR